MKTSEFRAQAPSKAQGTIEYLVIIAVVVVIALVVVSLLVGFTEQGSSIAQTTSQISVLSSGLAITDAASTLDGNIFVSITNNMGETIIITGLESEDKELSGLEETVPPGETIKIVVDPPTPCTEGETVIKTIKINYRTQSGLDKSQTIESMQMKCVDFNAPEGIMNSAPGGGGPRCGNGIRDGTDFCDGDTLPCDANGYTGSQTCLTDCTAYTTCTSTLQCGDNTVNGGETCDGTALAGQTCENQGLISGTLQCLPNCSGYNTSTCITPDTTPPGITLNTPLDNLTTTPGAIDFNFTASDNNAVKRCGLRINGTADVNYTDNINTISTTIKYTRNLVAGTYDWNITCTDYNNNSTTSATRRIILTTPTPITLSSSGTGAFNDSEYLLANNTGYSPSTKSYKYDWYKTAS